MNICYWNIHKNEKKQTGQFDTFLKEMLEEKSIDLFCISEFDQFDDSILINNNYVLVDNVNSDKVKSYKKQNSQFTLVRFDARYEIIKNNNILIVCLHSYDAINFDVIKRIHCMEDIKMNIDELLQKNADTNVFILGDFNCMPYDGSIVDEDLFNCVLYRDLLKIRKGAKERYYNPMLLLLSESEKIYGTFYSDSIKQENLRWYLLDQLMVNSNADKIIDYQTIKIITKVNGISLLNKNNKPNSNIYSDHLPLYFEIKEN